MVTGKVNVYAEVNILGHSQRYGSAKVLGLLMGVVVVVEVLVVHIFPGDPSNIEYLSAVEVLHAPQSVCAKDDAPKNMSSMLVTLDTSHLEMSLLNDDAEANMSSMLITLDTSHFDRSQLNNDA